MATIKGMTKKIEKLEKELEAERSKTKELKGQLTTKEKEMKVALDAKVGFCQYYTGLLTSQFNITIF